MLLEVKEELQEHILSKKRRKDGNAEAQGGRDSEKRNKLNESDCICIHNVREFPYCWY